MAKVLVVDDQRNMRTTLALMLGDAGYEVVEAYDGEHACDMVGGDAFDLVLTDLKMGSTDGIDVLRHTKEVAPLTERSEERRGGHEGRQQKCSAGQEQQ